MNGSLDPLYQSVPNIELDVLSVAVGALHGIALGKEILE
jgi:hypothetical protein